MTEAAGAAPGFADAVAARQRIAPHTHRTPVMTSSHLDTLVGAKLFFKCENLQKTGAFKARGAVNAVLALARAAAKHGVVTHSSGNHGQALAYAAARRGIAATIVMPVDANRVKKAAVRAYGGVIVECAPGAAARQACVEAIIAETGATLVHPYNDAQVIAGQGTCAMELADQVPDLDTVIVPIGGGGLMSGTCLALSEVAPEIAILGAEPAEANHAQRSLRAGVLAEPVDAPTTIADGLKAPLGNLTWSFVQRRVADVFAVTEAEIAEAMRLIWQRMKLVVEPSAAVPLAAILARGEVFADKRVGVILTGGNVDLDALPW